MNFNFITPLSLTPTLTPTARPLALALRYEKLCAKEKLAALRPTQVYSLCESLAVCGLLGLGGSSRGGGGRRRGGAAAESPLQRSVWLCISQDELRLATEELRVFRQMLS